MTILCVQFLVIVASFGVDQEWILNPCHNRLLNSSECFHLQSFPPKNNQYLYCVIQLFKLNIVDLCLTTFADEFYC